MTPIQWYPGHMTKTMRVLAGHVSLVDLVIELLDARIPYSSQNPDLDNLTRHKPRLVILNKADLADPVTTRKWEAFYTEKGFSVLAADARQKVKPLVETVRGIMNEKIVRQRQKGRLSTLIRAMVVGIPNVGKSTFINQVAGRASAAVEDRPGVTRGQKWIKVQRDFDLLDTPGVLWPKFDDPVVGLNLAMTGAISENVFDAITLSEELLLRLLKLAPGAVLKRYSLSPEIVEKVSTEEVPRELLTQIGNARGFKIKGGGIDILRTSVMLLDEFRGGKLGRISLERP